VKETINFPRISARPNEQIGIENAAKDTACNDNRLLLGHRSNADHWELEEPEAFSFS
jgi:hypothetical protein